MTYTSTPPKSEVFQNQDKVQPGTTLTYCGVDNFIRYEVISIFEGGFEAINHETSEAEFYMFDAHQSGWIFGWDFCPTVIDMTKTMNQEKFTQTMSELKIELRKRTDTYKIHSIGDRIFRHLHKMYGQQLRENYPQDSIDKARELIEMCEPDH